MSHAHDLSSIVQRPSSIGHGPSSVVVIGAGLAGSEAAWQAAQRGAQVTLYEMRPGRMTPAHETDRAAELVCSNSLGSNLPDRALGLLKNELRRFGSLIVACADRTAVPAGDALAVDREAFSRAVTEAIAGHPNIEIRREEVREIPQGVMTIIATGPLTSAPLAEAIRTLAGQDSLYFFDAMAPIITAESIDMTIAWRGNRWARGQGAGVREQAGIRESEHVGTDARLLTPDACLLTPVSAGDYINCPLSRDEYLAFVEAVGRAEKTARREFEADEAGRRYFEACLPIEVLAARDPQALAFGPMTPMGLRDPRTDRRPYAVVQLRQDNAAGTLYNLVGFQTNIRWGDQERVLRLIPGLARAEFVRFGQMHRNTFINSPRLLRPTLQWHDRDDLFCAGQITGTEGYVGSTAGGLLAGLNAVRVFRGQPPIILPQATMMGALFHYITRGGIGHGCAVDGGVGEASVGRATRFQPMKANFGLMPALAAPLRDKRQRHMAYAERACVELAAMLRAIGEASSVSGCPPC